MARKIKFNHKTKYMPTASDVIIKNMYTNEVIGGEVAYTPKELYDLLFSSKARRYKEWKLIGGYVKS